MPRTTMLTAALVATLIALPAGTPRAAETDSQPQSQTMQPPAMQPGTNQAPGTMGPGMMGGGMMGGGMMGGGMMNQGMQGQGMQGQGPMPMPYGAPQGQAMPPGSYGQGPAWGGDTDWHRRMHEWMEGRQPGYGHDQGYGYGPGRMGSHHEWHEHGPTSGTAPGCMGNMMQQGMMAPGMMGGGMMAPGMMAPGMMGGGMMQQGMMAPGMMGGGIMGAPGTGMDRGFGPGLFYGVPTATREVTVDEVRASLEYRLAWHGNPNLKLGKVEVQDGKIVAEIVTKDDSLVNRIAVDPKTGRWMPAN